MNLHLAQTSETLLGRLREIDDNDAWESFVRHYAPAIFHWSCRRGLTEVDAADVTQDVLMGIVRTMRTFEYDSDRGTFRGWLKTVTINAVNAYWKKQQRIEKGNGGNEQDGWMLAIPDESASRDLSETIAQESKLSTLAEAEQRVRQIVLPRTWQAYYRTAVLEEKAAHVADALDMPISDVYVAKSRVLKQLKQTVAKIEASIEHDVVSSLRSKSHG